MKILAGIIYIKIRSSKQLNALMQINIPQNSPEELWGDLGYNIWAAISRPMRTRTSPWRTAAIVGLQVFDSEGSLLRMIMIDLPLDESARPAI